MKPCTLAAVLAPMLCSGAAIAQVSDVDVTNKYCWGENVGSMNWRDADGASRGVRIYQTYLTGFIWSENVGWINVGDGPDDGVAYANEKGSDAGVNLDPSNGELSGLAWGQNVGWINFRGGAGATPSSPALYHAQRRRFYGYAWGENVGWINLNHDQVFVGTSCPADFNGDGFVDGIDYDEFNNFFESGDPGADFNRDGFVDGIDYDQFNIRFEAGC